MQRKTFLYIYVCKRKRKKVERKSNHTVSLFKLKGNTHYYRCLRNSSCFFLFQILHPLDCYKEAKRSKEGESRFPLCAQSDTRSLKTSGKKRFYENKHSLTYSLTRLLLFSYHQSYQGLSFIVKIEFCFDSCRLVRIVSLHVSNTINVKKKKRTGGRERNYCFLLFFVNRKS